MEPWSARESKNASTTLAATLDSGLIHHLHALCFV
jgi:hypothetical protein